MTPHSIHVLLVEDETAVATIMTHILEGAGYKVSVAGNGLDGLFLFKQRTAWDVAILDRAMPVMNGEELASQIRLKVADLPIVMVTGNVQAIVDPSQFQAILAKPFRPAELLKCLESVLRTPLTLGHARSLPSTGESPRKPFTSL